MLIGEVPDNDAAAIIIAKVRTVDTHRPGSLAISSQSDPHGDPLVFECPVFLIDKQVVPDGIVGNTHIHPSVMIGIEDGNPKRFGFWHPGCGIYNVQAGLLAYLLELTSPLVMVQVHMDTIKVGWLSISPF